jgi:hypothetical protein
MTITQTGYYQDNQGSWISKDPNAKLTYAMEWDDWLIGSDTIASVTYTMQVRANDPAPLIKDAQGITSGHLTYITLSGGNVGKVYTITAAITTADGLIDRRSFRVKVENRSA